MSSLIKRTSLVNFLKEQIIGPGATKYRFIRRSDIQLDSGSLSSSTVDATGYHNELINIARATVYSSGILFPENHTNLNAAQVNTSSEIDVGVVDPETGNEEEAQEEKELDSVLSASPGDDVEDDVTLDRQDDSMYPSTFAITCCLEKKDFQEEDVILNLRARSYNKLRQRDPDFFSYGVLCQINTAKLSFFLNESELLSSRFGIESHTYNSVLSLKPEFNFTRDISNIRTEIKNRIKTKIIAIKEALINSGFEKANKISENLGSIKQILYNEIKYSKNSPELQNLYLMSQEIEFLENAQAHLHDLMELHNTRSYGLWSSQEHSVNVSVSSFLKEFTKKKRNILYNSEPLLKKIILVPITEDEQASLSVNLQIIHLKNKAPDKIYVKVQVVNTSTPFTNSVDDGRYFSVANEKVNQKCFFDTKIKISSKFLTRYNGSPFETTEHESLEDRTTRFIYRHIEDFGVGHGCSVVWNKSQAYIESSYFPDFDLPDIESVPRRTNKVVKEDNEFVPSPFLQNNNVLEFKWLSDISVVSNEEVSDALKKFVSAYQEWIEVKEKEILLLSNDEQEIATEQIRAMRLDLSRMHRNVGGILSNSKTLSMFRMMNTAMYMQLWHSLALKANIPISTENLDSIKYYSLIDESKYSIKPLSWRPFQLAYILLNLDGIIKHPIDESWFHRNELVDLVWFPTGGGKTEAYLGIILLTIINRRQTHQLRGGGTACIIRYTLRLLTMQQFQRATLAIMALELLRRQNTKLLGLEPITVSLWVGEDSMPNKISGLKLEIQNLMNKTNSKIPFTACPWCNEGLRSSLDQEKDILLHFDHLKIHLYCINRNCPFSQKSLNDQRALPISLCDEIIYKHPPTLLFGTVDKFAQLAQKVYTSEPHKDSRRLFGRGNWESGKPSNGYIPPDLIIQDELHLLLGPLGSSVGLFETVIDILCTREDGTRPKVISSTATTRNTDLQIYALFDRKTNIFPKSGLCSDDNFFSFYKRVHESQESTSFKYVSKRKYLGILPTGRTQMWMQLRITALLLTHRALYESEIIKSHESLDFSEYKKNDLQVLDNYFSVLSYFNSLKEVGKTDAQVDSYIIKEIRRVMSRVLRPNKLLNVFFSYDSIQTSELTGRLSGKEVKENLSLVQKKFSPTNRFAAFNPEKNKQPPELILATNMISVGLDVGRFNQMIINSMPRNIAEYIQATSRVARSDYGLVITVHHPFRARDLSHFERFLDFHSKMYGYVEPISITPFTHKSIDRYLALFVATYIRHLKYELSDRSSAQIFATKNDLYLNQLVTEITSHFIKRQLRLGADTVNGNIKSLIRDEDISYIRDWLLSSLKSWRSLAIESSDKGITLVYNYKASKGPPQEELFVDLSEYKDATHSRYWRMPSSLRVVEPQAIINIKVK